jgi:hypothetical protein
VWRHHVRDFLQQDDVRIDEGQDAQQAGQLVPEAAAVDTHHPQLRWVAGLQALGEAEASMKSPVVGLSGEGEGGWVGGGGSAARGQEVEA